MFSPVTEHITVHLNRTELDATHSGVAESIDIAEHEKNPAGSPQFSSIITLDSLYSGAIDWSTCSISSEDHFCNHFCEHEGEKQHKDRSDSPNPGTSEEILRPLGRFTGSKAMAAFPGMLP